MIGAVTAERRSGGMSVDDLIQFTQVMPPDVMDDLASEAGAPTRLAITGKTANLDRLAQWSSLEALWVFEVNEAQLGKIIPLVDPQYLQIDGMRVADLSVLASLRRLIGLEIRWNTKAADISVVGNFTGLRLLALSHCPKVRDLTPIAALKDLEILELTGGMWSTFRPETLEPLRHLEKLAAISLKNIRVGDQSLQPLGGLKSLAHLEISNQFPTEEFARLSVALPDVECEKFAPYVDLRKSNPNFNVMVTGKGKPFLKLPDDKDRLARYVARFRQLQATYCEAQATANPPES
jgi:hypothetical protein